jgi:sarcosine oxidase, subunit beta
VAEARAEHREVVVVGAGIIGAACAYHLADRGLTVTVLERDDSPATGSTGLSAAGVRVQFVEPVNVALSLASIHAYREFETTFGVDSGYRPVGYLFLVPDEAWEAHLAGVQVQRHGGAPVEVLDLEVALERFGGFAPTGLAGATFGPIDGVVDPHSVTMGYLGAARERGVEVRLRSEVTAITSEGEGWLLSVGAGEDARHLRADVVVNAAGCWSGGLARLAGLDVPVAPARRSIWMTGPRADRRTTPLVVDVASGLYHRSEGERVLFGRSNPAEAPGFTTGVDWDFLEPTLEIAIERFPWFAHEELDAAASWYGYYEMTPDHNAVLGRHPDAASWVDATGFSGHGVQQAPAVGRAIAEEVAEGRAVTIDIDPLRLDRFRSGGERHERHVI